MSDGTLSRELALAQTAASERRRAPRLALDCRAKVHLCDTGRYLAGKARNLSATGALLEIDHPSLLVSGQRLRLGIAWSSRDAILPAQDMVSATVVRSLGLGAMQTVAISFDKAMALPAPAAISA